MKNKVKKKVLPLLLAGCASMLVVPTLAFAGDTGTTGKTNAEKTVDESVDKSTTQVIGVLNIVTVKSESETETGDGDGHIIVGKIVDEQRIVYDSGEVKVDCANPCSDDIQELIKEAENKVNSLGKQYEENNKGAKYESNGVSGNSISHDNRQYQWVSDDTEGTAILVGDDDYNGGTYDASGTEGRHMLVTGDYGRKTVYTVEGTVTLPEHIHKLEKIEASDSTCDKEGNNEYFQCTECKEYFKDPAATTSTTVEDEKLEKVEHTSAEPVKENVVEATETSEGGYYEVIRCSVCGEELSRTHKTIAKLESNSEETEVADVVDEKESVETTIELKKTSASESKISKTSPNTGDASSTIIWVAILCVSVSGIVSVVLIDKKRRTK